MNCLIDEEKGLFDQVEGKCSISWDTRILNMLIDWRISSTWKLICEGCPSKSMWIPTPMQELNIKPHGFAIVSDVIWLLWINVKSNGLIIRFHGGLKLMVRIHSYIFTDQSNIGYIELVNSSIFHHMNNLYH